MHASNLDGLREARTLLRARWESLLRAQPVHSPMGHPDTLMHLMDWTIDDVFDRLRRGRSPSKSRSGQLRPPLEVVNRCACGANPLLCYFSTIRRAFLDWAEQDSFPFARLALQEREGCIFEFLHTLETVTEREIQNFCAVCQQGRRKQPCGASSISGDISRKRGRR